MFLLTVNGADVPSREDPKERRFGNARSMDENVLGHVLISDSGHRTSTSDRLPSFVWKKAPQIPASTANVR